MAGDSAMGKILPGAVQPSEAIRFFRNKGFRLGFDWRDTWHDQHAQAFTVAKAMDLDILADIREAVDTALAEGQTLRTFEKNLTPILQKKGWWGRKKMLDPLTGKTRSVQLGSPRRLKIIYLTNLKTAHMAGKWERIERRKKYAPFLRYVAVDDAETRPEHRAWHGIIRKVDDAFWDQHYPPNGWRCRCNVIQMTQEMLDQRGLKESPRQKPKMRDYKNARTGEVTQAPEGVTPGFANNVGQAARQYDPALVKDLPVLTPSADYKSLGLSPARKIRARKKAPKKIKTPGAGDFTLTDPDGMGVVFTAEQMARLAAGEDQATVTAGDGMGVIFPLGIIKSFFRRDGGGGESVMGLAKKTVEAPDEIWLVPKRLPGGEVVMEKRYIGFYRDPSSGAAGADLNMVVERSREGFAKWAAVSAAAMDKKREGYLLSGGEK